MVKESNAKSLRDLGRCGRCEDNEQDGENFQGRECIEMVTMIILTFQLQNFYSIEGSGPFDNFFLFRTKWLRHRASIF